MALDKADMEGLRSAATRFDTKNHTHYLAEAGQSIERSGDPIEGLRLLYAMWSSSYAARPQQKTALNDIGEWLEQQLNRDPKVSVEHITLQLGWLRRLACYYGKLNRDERSDSAREKSDRGRGFPQKLECRFGGPRIEALLKRRTETNQAPPKVERRQAVPAPPERLPKAFAAGFVDFLAARSVRQMARERAKRGKPAKESLLALQPTDSQLRTLAAGLCCSSISTDGFDTLFTEIEKRAGVLVPFYVTELEVGGGGLLVRRILLTPPADDEVQRSS